MTRIEFVERFVNECYMKVRDPKWQIRAIAHSHAVSRMAVLLARRRGEDAEIAAVSGLLHDLYAYEHLDYADHAHLGAGRAREVLAAMGMFSEKEMDAVYSAVWHHDDLDQTGSPMDEILKDADLFDNSLGRQLDALKPHEQKRLMAALSELGIRQD